MKTGQFYKIPENNNLCIDNSSSLAIFRSPLTIFIDDFKRYKYSYH